MHDLPQRRGLPVRPLVLFDIVLYRFQQSFVDNPTARLFSHDLSSFVNYLELLVPFECMFIITKKETPRKREVLRYRYTSRIIEGFL